METKCNLSPLEQKVILILLLLCFLPLGFVLQRELALDEIGIWWMIKDDYWTAMERVLFTQGRGSPIYFSLLWIICKLFGLSCLSLRVMSIVAAIASGYFVYKTAKILDSPRFAWYSALAFLALPSTLGFASDAGPYSTAILFVIIASFYQLRWLSTGLLRFAVGYAVFYLCAIYSHYLFVLVGAFHTVWFLLTIWLSNLHRRILLQQAITVLAITVCGLTPLYYVLRVRGSRSQAMSFTPLTSLSEFMVASIPAGLALLLLLTALLSVSVWRERSRAECTKRALTKTFTYSVLLSILPVLMAQIVSLFLGFSIFLDRYFSYRTLGIALVTSLILTQPILPSRRLILAFFHLVLLYAAVFGGPSLERSTEGLAAATAYARERNDCLVLAFTGYIEAQNSSNLRGGEITDFIASPLLYHWTPNSFLLLPYSFDDEQGYGYFKDVVLPGIAERSCILVLYRNVELYIGGKSLLPSPLYLANYIPRMLGLPLRTHKSFGLTEVMIFENS